MPYDAVRKFWETQDWSKSTRQLMADLGKGRSTVQYWRNQVKNPAEPNWYQLNRTKWEAFDWSKSDSELAKEHGCSVHGFRYWRKTLNRPASQNKGTRVNFSQKTIQGMILWKRILEALPEYKTQKALALALGVDEHTVCKAKDPRRPRARMRVANAVKKGRLRRPEACEVCGTVCKPSGHHDDYGKVFAVRWLCSRCHADADKKQSEKEKQQRIINAH